MQLLWWTGLSALLLSLPGALLHVAAPKNVRVQCGDQRPLVSWDYSSRQQTNFTVLLLGSEKSFSDQTEGHELDLSDFVWSSSRQMFAFHYVSVTAEQGPNRSEPSDSPSFSYNWLKAVDKTCNLKFPPMNLTGEGAEATLSLENPLYFYDQLKTIKPSAVFHLKIITESNRLDRQCSREQICKFSVDLPENAEPCVNLTGVISFGAEEISVQHSDPVCATPPSDGYWVVAILCIVVIVFVIIFAIIGVCKYRAWAFPKIPTPKTLVLNPPSFRPSMSQPDTVYSPVQISIPRPRTNSDPESPSPLESFKVQDEDQVLFLPEDPREDLYESEDSMKTETLSLHSSGSEIEESNYERRVQLIEIDVSGDLVTGYTS